MLTGEPRRDAKASGGSSAAGGGVDIDEHAKESAAMRVMSSTRMRSPQPPTQNSVPTADWTRRLGHEMHEITLETNAYFLVLVFHDLVVQKLNDQTDLISQVHLPLKG